MDQSKVFTEAKDRYKRLMRPYLRDVTAANESFSRKDHRRYLDPLIGKMDSSEAINLQDAQRELVEVVMDVALIQIFEKYQADHIDGSWKSVVQFIGSDEISVDFLTEIINHFMIGLAILKKAKVPAAEGVFMNFPLWQPMFVESVERIMIQGDAAT